MTEIVAGTRPRRVVLVLGSSTGGVGRHVRSLADHLIRGGHRVRVCGPAETDRIFDFRSSGARFHPVEIPADPDPVRDLVAVANLRRSLTGTDVVHAHGLRAGLVSALARRTQAMPLVVTWHNLLLGAGWKHGVLTRLERLVARAADVTLAASEDLAARVLSLGGRDVRFAPVAAPPLTQPESAPDEVRAGLGAAGRPLVLSVGRLHPQKGFDVLVDAAARWTTVPGSPLVAIAGSGPQEQELVERAARADAPVTFLGRRTDVAALLAAADVAVVTSRWEARQLFAQEALQAGTPLVATAVGGMPGLLRDGAVLVPAGDVDAVDRAVRRLLADSAAAAELVERGHRVAADWPTESDTAEQVAALYDELLGTTR